MSCQPDDSCPSVIERWFLRYLRLHGFCVPGRETFDAAVRAGAARDHMAAAEAFFFLRRRGWTAFANGMFFLTNEGRADADVAARLATLLQDPRVPIPERFLPKMVWADDD